MSDHVEHPDLREGEAFCGFLVEGVQNLPEIDGRAWVLRHEKLGTPVLWLDCDDEDKAFAIAFKTPPADDTGVFHILEHSVLCGSERFPVKEPFVNLLKTSMQTFLNALTFGDKTMYPVSSTNEQDLLNLMDVYLDAVLHPALHHKRSVFEQEGWHYEVDPQSSALTYNGVVFNEMKGARSDPEDVALQELGRALFPDTTYGFESGGNPRAIPSLTYERYADTHLRHYNPENAHVVLYGDIGLRRELELLDRALSGAPQMTGEPNPLLPQSPVVKLDASCAMETSPENACVLCGYVIGTYVDRLDVLATTVLVESLMGSNEAPLKRRLLELGLGDDVDAFVYDGVLQPYVVFELCGAEEGVASTFRTGLEQACEELVREGIPRDCLKASCESLAFSLRERDSGYPEGVSLAMSAMSGWLYDDARPLDYLRYEEELAQLRRWLEEDGFERLLERLVLQSNHHAQVELICLEDGDPQGAAASERRELEQTRALLGDEAVAQLAARAEELHRLQAAPDTPEQLATLPRLARSDIGPGRAEPAYGLADDTPLPCLHHKVPTRRIDYLGAFFDLSGLTWDELPAASLVSDLLGKLDTTEHTATELDTLIEERLGRLSFTCFAHRDMRDNSPFARMGVYASAIEENVDDLAGLPREILLSTRFDDLDRIRTILQQQRLDLEQSFASSGHIFALSRASAYVSRPHMLANRFGGVDYYRFIRDLLDNFDSVAPSLPARLEDLSRRIFTSTNVLFSFTGPQSDLERFWRRGGDFGIAPAAETGRLVIPEPQIRNEAFVVPTDVCFVAKADDGAHTQAVYSGSWDVAASALNYGYLWDEVRVQGGAYGCGFRVRADGYLGYYTYRDPNLDETLARFDKAPDWLAAWRPDEDEVDGYVVSTIASAADAPLKPRILAARQASDYLCGRGPAWRERRRAEMLATSAQDLTALAPCLRRLSERDAVCVFGSREKIESSSHEFEVIDLLSR